MVHMVRLPAEHVEDCEDRLVLRRIGGITQLGPQLFTLQLGARGRSKNSKIEITSPKTHQVKVSELKKLSRMHLLTCSPKRWWAFSE